MAASPTSTGPIAKVGPNRPCFVSTKTHVWAYLAPQHWRGRFLSTLTGRYQVLYSAADTGFAKRIQDFQKTLAPISVEDASIGLFSVTQASKGVALIQPFGDGIIDIVTGRRPLSDLDGMIKDWRSGVGGDAPRAEYEKAYAAPH
jgi:hypothetical protein